MSTDSVLRAPCESSFEGRMVFVLGTARSGTSWLNELFRVHPQFAGSTAESMIFNALADLWDNAYRSDGEGVVSLVPLDEIPSLLRDYCDRVFSAARDRIDPAATWFVEKSPTHSQVLPIMAATHPDAWYVHIVRDGRDVVRSLLEAPFGSDDPGEAAALWAANVSSIRNQSWRLPRFREIRYEAMLEDPVGTMASLLEWMGAPAGDDVIEMMRARSGEEVARFGSASAVGAGKWRSMPPDALAAIDKAAHDALAELGYLSP